MPNVGLWGQLCLRVVRYKNLTVKSSKLPQTEITSTYKYLQSVKTITRYTKMYKLNTRYNNVSVQGLPSMPQ